MKNLILLYCFAPTWDGETIHIQPMDVGKNMIGSSKTASITISSDEELWHYENDHPDAINQGHHHVNPCSAAIGSFVNVKPA